MGTNESNIANVSGGGRIVRNQISGQDDLQTTKSQLGSPSQHRVGAIQPAVSAYKSVKDDGEKKMSHIIDVGSVM